ncbi:molecular chaperone DnaJ [Candidatus Peribacteria bacterium RIFCSPHIGHO2_02_FULL_53_20]|nr:MAG: molecular chaperone DnaJ [Candidatus Peribacteria bacterium RIFCSPHIGHO2_02_FULL_53_20]OGJ67001.1 MAG: molecular chaperone DnaJ [Candidatus Peribacteria bacterium RIFCSPLOWO2_01_FULL_53_10]OGJ71688.1 MAG: molecular chaperone DnaJ [Candidatus Peribacteria bacterium RIFCSPLOWO2_12_FULL_53_10]
MPKDFYSILGVSRDASPEDLKKAYRKLSKELHPDKHKGDKDVEHKFKEINEAYEALSDPQKRKTYDQFGRVGNGGTHGGGGFDFSGFSGAQGGDFGGIGDLFETFFSGRGGRAPKKEEGRGRDLEMRVRIDFMESVTGVQRKIAVRRLQTCTECKGQGNAPGAATVTCGECGGTGQLTRTAQSFFGTIRQSVLCAKCGGSGKVPEKMCAICDGEGRVLSNDEVTVDIPAGIADGQTLRLRSHGEAGRRGATSGDLFVRIDVPADTRFTREGDDMHSAMVITVLQAMLGDDIAVDTVHGSVSLRIPPGTQPSQVFRLKGKGMPALKGRGHGDHYVTVRVEVPTKLSREERRLLEEWKTLQS